MSSSTPTVVELMEALRVNNLDSYRLFFNRNQIEGYRRLLGAKKITSELDLRLFQSQAIEEIVTNIINILSEHELLRHRLGLDGGSLIFENHANTLKNGADDVQARQQSFGAPNKPPATPANMPIHNESVATCADQLCIYHTSSDRRKLLFPIEYKAPHKFTNLILRQGFRPMDIAKEVINRITRPQDDQGNFCYAADRLVAAATTQTYAYMLESRREYGCIITGESIVFLRIAENAPHTLEYCLVEPGVACQNNTGGFPHNMTAVAQMLGFVFMAFESKQHTNNWIDKAEKTAPRWTMDDDAILDSIPATMRKSPPMSPAYQPARVSQKIEARSPYYQRQRRRQGKQAAKYSGDDLPKPELKHDDSDDSDSNAPDAGNAKQYPETPTATAEQRQGQWKKQNRNRSRGNWEASESDAHINRAYCTQTCILGLVRRSTLDPNCPHVESHRRGGSNNHMLDNQQVCTLLQEQLDRSLDHNCTDLQIYGSRCMLFKVTLASHGYTIVAKGTRDVFVVDLKHERGIYDRLTSIQGEYIPVHLGSIDLAHPWYDYGGVRVIHMLLLAHGGKCLSYCSDIPSEDLSVQTRAFEKMLACYGIEHRDLERRNMLWNEELRRVMFVDFERSTVDQRTGVFHPVSPNLQQTQVGPVGIDEEPEVVPCWLDMLGADETIGLPLPSPQAQVTEFTTLSASPSRLLAHVPTSSDDSIREKPYITTAKPKRLLPRVDLYQNPDVASPPHSKTKEPLRPRMQTDSPAAYTSKVAPTKPQAAGTDQENIIPSVETA
ncbi:MAG: hypothetical protein Q9192_001597 [Flavoplaca navasiana]